MKSEDQGELHEEPIDRYSSSGTLRLRTAAVNPDFRDSARFKVMIAMKKGSILRVLPFNGGGYNRTFQAACA